MRQGRTDTTANGSSPRVRGTCDTIDLPSNVTRFIPACAGNMRRLKSWWVMSTVHPRVCGEHVTCFCASISASGSSPRVRGTYLRPHRRIPRRRFIPACAGNILVDEFIKLMYSVHPRVCGEHRRLTASVCWSTGSSPRVRGTYVNTVGRDKRKRFIPACAGNISPFGAVMLRIAVHPRVCGEHATNAARQLVVLGSSPRVRGT